MTLKEQIDISRLPKHVAVIMDGNGRWARKKGLMRVFGHQNGVKAVRETVEAAAEIGISYLTLYAFSTENWSRPKSEVDALMELLITTLSKELSTLMDNDIRLKTIGDFNALPKKCQSDLQSVMEQTAENSRMTLVLALSYSARWECVEAFRNLARDVSSGLVQPDDIDEQVISSYMTTRDYPDPELLIRTSGEQRISNFLLWQIAYTELYFTDVLWPDFRKNDFYKALLDFQRRERRFGKTSDQIKNVNEVS